MTNPNIGNVGGKGPAIGDAGGAASDTSYQIGAVAFDGATGLVDYDLSCTDNEYVAIAYWVYFSTSFSVPDSNYYITWVIDPVSSEISYDALISDNIDLLGQYQSEVGDSTHNYFVSLTDPLPATLGEWLHYLEVYQTNFSAGNKLAYLYRNGVLIPATVLDGSPAFVNRSNGLSFFVGYDTFGDNLVGYLADFMYLPGANLLTGGVVTQATIEMFIKNGKPVDPAAAIAAYSPAIFLHQPHGNTDPTQFAINRGPGGPFTIVGDPLTIAPSSPSD